MNLSNQDQPGHGHVSARHRLLEEISFFERRLVEMSHSGDCAYENALARTYQALLDARRGQLAALNRAEHRI